MRGRRRVRATACALALGLLAACGGSDTDSDDPAPTSTQERLEADCRSTVDTLLETTQRYLDAISGTTTSSSGASPAPVPDPAEAEQQFTDALANVRSYAGSIGCDPDQFRDDLAGGLRELDAGGPVARAVLLQLRADSEGVATDDVVEPGQDVALAVAAAPQDGVVQLGAGTHELAETLVLLRGVTVRGAGRDATTLRSAAPEGVVLVLTGESVTLDALTLARPDGAAGSVVTGAPAASLTISGVRVTGATADADGSGGIGVLMAAGAAGQTGLTRRTSLTVTDSEVLDNAVAGVVVSGDHRADIARSTFERVGQCGICFLATSDGTVADSRLAGSAAGIVVSGDARPVIRATTIEGGEVGVQALERTAPQVEAVTVTGAARAAFLFADSSTGAVRGSTCTDVPFGIVVGPQAGPEVDGNACELARGE